MDWTLISNVAAAAAGMLATLATVAGVAWKVASNHIKHLEAGLRTEISDMHMCVEKRFDKMEASAVMIKQDLILQQESIRMDFIRFQERAREDLAQHTASEQQFFGERMSGMERDIREIRERLMRGA